jgi:putative transposase
MTRRRHTPDEIIRKLAEGNKLFAGGAELDEVCRHLEIAESTWHRWVAQYGGLKATDAKRLKELEGEHVRPSTCPPSGSTPQSPPWETYRR